MISTVTALPRPLTAISRRRTDDGVHLYEVATDRPGVPHSIEVRHTWLGLRRNVVVRDVTGAELLRDSSWRIGRHIVQCQKDGIMSHVKLTDRTITVRSPRVDLSGDGFSGGHHVVYREAMEQTVEADGTMHLKAGLTGEYDFVPPIDRVPQNPISGHQRRYTEVTLPPQGSPRAHEVQEFGETRRIGNPVKVRVEFDTLVTYGADGQQAYPLYIDPARLHTE